jgi:streptogramin lyase
VPAIVKTIQTGRHVDKLTFGGDGLLYYTGQFAPLIGRVTVGGAGAYSEFTLPTWPDGTTPNPIDIVTAPDGSVWFNFEGYPSSGIGNDSGIGTIARDGTLTLYRDPISAPAFPLGLTVGRDGNLWFSQANANKVSRMTLAGVVTSFPLPAAGGYSTPGALTSGPDGNIWAADYFYVARVGLDGSVIQFPTPYAHGDTNAYFIDALAPGSDGNVWYSESQQNGSATIHSKIAKITPSGTITEYPVPAGHFALSIVAGRDGNMWFIDAFGIGSVTPAGTMTFYPLLGNTQYFSGMTAAPDNGFWLTQTTNGGGSSVMHFVY